MPFPAPQSLLEAINQNIGDGGGESGAINESETAFQAATINQVTAYLAFGQNRQSAWRISLCAFVLLLFVVSASASAFEIAAVISGIAQVKDGDGILFGTIEIRLQGVAAPESSDPDGPESTANLRSIVEGEFVVCHLDGTNANRRPVGICYVGNTDVGAYQIENGYARDCPAFSSGRYANAESKAVDAGKNLATSYPLPGYC